MDIPLPSAGAANAEVALQAHQSWYEAASHVGVDVSGLAFESSLESRLAWALSIGLTIGCILSRFSSKLQHSTSAQVVECVRYAAAHGIYVPPEYVSVDEGVSGRKQRRDGLNRAKAILQAKRAQVLLVFKVSRLFRVAYKGFAFFQEEVVEEGLRAISISQAIDTADDRSWKQLAYLHGIMDEMLLTTIADHVRSGLSGLFQQGYVTGPLTVGYKPVEVTGAAPTNRGLPRTVPAIDQTTAPLIVQHFEWIRDGMPISEGHRRWKQAGGPYDARSSLGHMSYNAYRRMLSNVRYTGLWSFGRKRNSWSSKRDYTRQIDQDGKGVINRQCEELRIVDDSLFAAVQARLASNKLGRRTHKRKAAVQLWDLVTDCFYCSHCKVRFYQTGARGKGMGCKNRESCPCHSAINRREAVTTVCMRLGELVNQDADLIADTVRFTENCSSTDQAHALAELAALERKIAARTRKIVDLTDLAGDGSDEDRAMLKQRIREAQANRAALQSELAQKRVSLQGVQQRITPEQVHKALKGLADLLIEAASGTLGPDLIYVAASTFRLLVKGKIEVFVERRAGRKRTQVRASFLPDLLHPLKQRIGDARQLAHDNVSPVEVWLRKPPRLDCLASRVHELVDMQGHSYRKAAAILRTEGHKVNSGGISSMRKRYYEMRGMEPPPRSDAA